MSVSGARWRVAVPMPPTGPLANAVVPASAEGVGAKAHDDPPAPITAAAGAAGNHDQCVRPYPRPRGEVGPQGDGSVRQQHHLGAVPVPQPAGAYPASPAPLGGPQVPPWELNFRPPWPLVEHPRWRRLRVSFRALLSRTPAFSPTLLR